MNNKDLIDWSIVVFSLLLIFIGLIGAGAAYNA